MPLADLQKKTSSLRENPNEFVVERERERVLGSSEDADDPFEVLGSSRGRCFR